MTQGFENMTQSFCDLNNHTPDAYLIDEEFTVLLKCTKCSRTNIDIFSKEQQEQIKKMIDNAKK
jgi:hypothetical protein